MIMIFHPPNEHILEGHRSTGSTPIKIETSRSNRLCSVLAKDKSLAICARDTGANEGYSTIQHHMGRDNLQMF